MIEYVNPTSDQQAAAESAKQAREEARQKITEAEDKRRAKQEENNAKAAEVMETSVPFPSQEQNDQARLGILNIDELEAPEQPEMPPLHEQRKVD